MYVEIIPSEITDVVGQSISDKYGRCRAIDNSRGYKTMNDAILNIEVAGLRLLSYVVPENLLLCFGETMQSLRYAFYSFANNKPILYPPIDFYGPVYDDESHTEKKYYGDEWAVLLCKIIDSKICEPFFGSKCQKGANNPKHYEITWREFQYLKKKFDESINHTTAKDMNWEASYTN